MQYLCLIYEDESISASQSQEEQGAVFAGYMAFGAEISAAGKMVGGDALQPIATATTVRIRNGQTLHTDGPFAETREQLGGYYLIESDNLDEALKWAAKIPAAKTGSVEVRPVMVFPKSD